jgi:DNA-binding response OmpR family regulator
MDGYVSKPINPADLFAAIEALARGGNSRRSTMAERK